MTKYITLDRQVFQLKNVDIFLIIKEIFVSFWPERIALSDTTETIGKIAHDKAFSSTKKLLKLLIFFLFLKENMLWYSSLRHF